ncbi:MAG: glycoside hydrolase family 9 protein [Kiritimatiellae bacterium]|nr:glycoside hydrolase family 9 protein [Kiritimatiellia bacterium]
MEGWKGGRGTGKPIFHPSSLPFFLSVLLVLLPPSPAVAELTLELTRAPGEMILSWPAQDRAVEYQIECAATLAALTQTVAVVSNRHGEGAQAGDVRFYRVQALVEDARTVSDHIQVDQFGYLPEARKVAVVSNPIVGFNATNAFAPGPWYEVRRVTDGAGVYSNQPAAWNSGATHSNSGDQVWWFDFSSVTEPGNYYVYDGSNAVSSPTFRIADDVYREVLKQAFRTFYYQRGNLAKLMPFAETNWTDAAPSHVGTEQDADCRLVSDGSAGTALDLTGGWFDAGDFNKYVNFADKVVHDLLAAYEQNPGVWSDHCQIPESGNGVPDLLDEIQYELDWLLKMQRPDGSVLHKVSSTNWSGGSPPSTDTMTRRYAPATASATISAAGAFAHAAVVFKGCTNAALQAYGATLAAAATNAWNWLAANPGQIPSSYDNAGFVNAAAEDSAYEQQANRTGAAAYLFALTGDASFRAYFDEHFRDVHLMEWHYIYSSEVPFQDALLYYTALPGATASNVTAITNAYSDAAGDMLAQYTNQVDAYRAWIDAYYWGSNTAKGDNGSMLWSATVYGVDAGNTALYREAAAGYAHYLHGVNPLGLVYLSNMGRYGAERSVPEFYHTWYANGTDWDNADTSLYGPAPGFLVGGPNPDFEPDPSYSGPPLEPPQNQPAQKSYRSWNTDWPENSWEITENAIYCQSAYVKLLSKLAR